MKLKFNLKIRRKRSLKQKQKMIEVSNKICIYLNTGWPNECSVAGELKRYYKLRNNLLLTNS